VIKFLNWFLGTALIIPSIFFFKVDCDVRSKFFRLSLVIKRSNKEQVCISEVLITAITTIEDKRYFKHSGVDFYAILRALSNNLRTNRIQGASTITQQFVRNVTNMRRITVKRKIKEIVLAVLIEQAFSKMDIFQGYLNTYKIGSFNNVSTFCLSKNLDLKHLSVIESAEIAARLKYPYIRNSNYIKYLKRVRTIEKKLDSKQFG
jgi:membrane peptidoglycan carboxypeptidase